MLPYFSTVRQLLSKLRLYSLGIDPRTRAALHAPTSKDWAQSFNFPYGTLGLFLFLPLPSYTHDLHSQIRIRVSAALPLNLKQFTYVGAPPALGPEYVSSLHSSCYFFGLTSFQTHGFPYRSCNQCLSTKHFCCLVLG